MGGKNHASLLKELKDARAKIKFVFLDEIKKAHAEKVNLKEELKAHDMIIEAQKMIIADHDKIVEVHNKTNTEYEEIMKSLNKTISDQAQTIALLQERITELSANKTRIEVEMVVVTADYLELQDTFKKKIEKMDIPS